MNEPVSSAELDRFRELIVARLGLSFDPTRNDLLTESLRSRAGSRGAPAYMDALSSHADPSEIAALASLLTVSETSFFRNQAHFDVLAEIALPARAIARGPGARIDVLSLGCASGEEAYTAAMVARATGFGHRVSVRGIDVNETALAAARAATYSAWSLRNTPVAVRAQWFRASGSRFALANAGDLSVTFAAGNIADPNAAFWQSRHDIVFCRNVLMYFDVVQARAAVERIRSAMMPGGFLFIGEAETLRGLSEGFSTCNTHGTFYYQEGAGNDTRQLPAGVARDVPAHAFLPAPGTPWVDVIRGATDRVDKLMQAVKGADVSGETTVVADLGDQVAPDAGDHYMLALSCETAGDDDGARENDEAAIQLDPTFAMARLHLGLLTCRRKGIDTARIDLVAALHALERETPARLEQFGGGFDRDALIAICKFALASCERMMR
jgi:chemotaxis protein methyltransferase CheR